VYSVLNSIEPLSSRNYVFDRLVPFELDVLHVRLKYWTGDFVGYLDTMYAMVKKCKLMAKIALEEGEREREKELERDRRGGMATGIGGRSIKGPRGDGGAALAAMWRERGCRMVLIIASQFIEMKVCVLPQLSTTSLIVGMSPSQPARWIRCRSGIYGCHTPPRTTLHSTLTRTAFSSWKGISPGRSPRPSSD
jgi:trafficking protein particle complex subunit 12